MSENDTSDTRGRPEVPTGVAARDNPGWRLPEGLSRLQNPPLGRPPRGRLRVEKQMAGWLILLALGGGLIPWFWVTSSETSPPAAAERPHENTPQEEPMVTVHHSPGMTTRTTEQTESSPDPTAVTRPTEAAASPAPAVPPPVTVEAPNAVVSGRAVPPTPARRGRSMTAWNIELTAEVNSECASLISAPTSVLIKHDIVDGRVTKVTQTDRSKAANCVRSQLWRHIDRGWRTSTPDAKGLRFKYVLTPMK